MNQRIFVPTFGPSNWRLLLADPNRQWRQGKSAYELAITWEATRNSDRGMPLDVADVLDGVPELRDARLAIGIPEHQVTLDGGGHASQTDPWALLRTQSELISVAVEGKAGEGFDRPVPEWLRDASPRSGKPKRLEQLCRVLGISEQQAHLCRYQLLHRTAVAILEARRFKAAHALLLVQSFVADPDSVADFKCFGEQFGVIVHENAAVSAGVRDGVSLWLAWVTSRPATDEVVRAALV